MVRYPMQPRAIALTRFPAIAPAITLLSHSDSPKKPVSMGFSGHDYHPVITTSELSLSSPLKGMIVIAVSDRSNLCSDDGRAPPCE
jgi:hypothetical protein